jgi:hypothetical protein
MIHWSRNQALWQSKMEDQNPIIFIGMAIYTEELCLKRLKIDTMVEKMKIRRQKLTQLN